MTRFLTWFKRRPIITAFTIAVLFYLAYWVGFGYLPVWMREWWG